MPAMLTIRPNEEWTPPKGAKAAEKKALDEAFKAIQAAGKKEVSAVTAYEAIRLSKGMYELEPQEAAPAASAPVADLESMPIEQLKLMMLQLGVNPTKKQMKRSEIIAMIRRGLDEFEIEEDDAPEEGDGEGNQGDGSGE